MNIKNTIRFVEYSSVFALCAFLLMVLSLLSSQGSAVPVNFWILGLSVLLFFAYFFKNRIIRYRIQRSKYQELFYYIIHKIHLSEQLSIGLATPSKSDINAYHLCEEDFIQDNRLTRKIGRRRAWEWGMVLNIVLFIVLVLLAYQLFAISVDNTAMIIVIGCMVIAFSYLFSNSSNRFSGEPLIVFDSKSLTIGSKEIAWCNILDWQYNRRDATNNSSISVYYFNSFLDVESETIELFQVNIRKIDLVLLLTLYKEKYGQNIY